MSAKRAPLKPGGRRMVYGDQIPPPKIAKLLDDPVLCSKIAGCWDSLERLMTTVIMELPLFCKKEGLDASAVVLAANKILTTAEVFKDQALFDRETMKPQANEENPTQ